MARAPQTAARRLSGGERRAQLVALGIDLFAEHGYHGLSMEQLADAAGVSKPVLYQHFPSKRDLYLAIVHDAVAELDRRVRGALAGTTSNRDRVQGAIYAYFDFVEDRRFRLLFSTAELTDEGVRNAIEGAMATVAQAVAGLIAEDAALSPRAALFLACGLRGLAMDGARWWVEQDEVDKDEAVRLLSRLAWRGLGSFGPAD